MHPALCFVVLPTGKPQRSESATESPTAHVLCTARRLSFASSVKDRSFASLATFFVCFSSLIASPFPGRRSADPDAGDLRTYGF
uniref:Secreted protein n=1 Tax=Steinernema glaseri TaxID=37863 RepID=A0A1I7ZBL0_9BILA